MFRWFTDMRGWMWDIRVLAGRIERKVSDIQKAMLEHCEAAKEDALGPFQYEITASDLFILSPRHRTFVCCSNARYFNDVCTTGIYAYNQGVLGPDKNDIETIMEWKRECVARITEKQVSDAIDAIKERAKETTEQAQ